MAKKAGTSIKGKTKKQLLEEAIAEAVGAGKELHLESVDFSDPNRPKTCLEVDFPILPINQVAAIEGNAGKPIYQMSKWWARRRSSVFRAMLIAAATKAPDDPGEAAKLVWDSYYGNHQKNEAFKNLKVADIFMGGGTTIVEGSRLGMQMFGNDLNPVAWFVVKNELAKVEPDEVNKLLDHIESEVKPQVTPFYTCECPRGHRAKWTHKATGKIMGEDFDSLSLKRDERPDYRYEGPEVIYTFWVKHGQCQATGCGHRTPIMSSPVVAIKTLTVKAWEDWPCKKCGKSFDIEQHAARMAPSAIFVSASDEKPHTVMDESGTCKCPHCDHLVNDPKGKVSGASIMLGKASNKSVDLTLLVHPDWLEGSAGHSIDGSVFGGSTVDDCKSTAAWLAHRAINVRLIEFRGLLPESIVCPETSKILDTTEQGGTVPKRSHFTCAECGTMQDVLASMTRLGKSGPVVPLMSQCFCEECKVQAMPYGGRYFLEHKDMKQFILAHEEWENRKSNDLEGFWPTTKLPKGFKTSYQRLPEHGYPRFLDMFNPRQLLGHAQLL